MLLIEFKCSIFESFSLEIVHTNCSKMASSLEIMPTRVTGVTRITGSNGAIGVIKLFG